MPTPLLATKLFVPMPRTNVVLRPRLIAQLNGGLRHHESLGRKLTLISAPAGFGKTTLVSAWVTGCARPVAWLSLDEGDNDPTRFLTYLVAALQTLPLSKDEGPAPKLGGGVMNVLQAPQPPSYEAILTALLNEVAALSDDFILVLDDCHLIDSQPVGQALTFLVEHLPPQMHLVIATREDPPLPLARLRARGQLTELRAADLRFTRAEAAGFLSQVMGLRLAADDIAALEARTEGWVAGLQLAAISLQGHPDDTSSFIASFTGSHHFVLDYLVEEVLHQQPADIQIFLLHTSILDRLYGPLCDAVLHDAAGGQATLHALERANLFVFPMDSERRWYRYHHLFGDLLRTRLEQEAPDLALELHRRAAEWYLHAGVGDSAMHHALATKDAAFAADIAQQFGVAMVGGSRLGTFQAWIKRIDPAAVAQRPYLLAGIAWTYVLTGHSAEALCTADAADAALAGFAGCYSVIDDRQITAAEVRGHLNAVRGYAARLCGDSDSVVRYARLALTDLPRDVYTVRSTIALNLALLEMERGELDAALAACAEAYAMGIQHQANLFVALSALSIQGEIHLQRGQIQMAATHFQRVLTLGVQDGPPAVGVGLLGLARIALLQGDPAEARRLLGEGMQLAQELASSEAVRQAALFAAEIALYAGDLEQTRRHLAEIDAHAQPGHAGHTGGDEYAVLSSRLALSAGDVAAAATWLDACLAHAHDEPLANGQQQLALAADLQRVRLLLAQNRSQAALHLLVEVERLARTLEEWQATISILLLRAIAQRAQGENAGAQTTLIEAITLAAPQGAISPFVLQGHALAGLLAEIAGGSDSVSSFAARVLQLLPRQTGASKALQVGLVDPLSGRELDVLRLMAAGRTNKAIAVTLIVAPSTVKTHTNHILAKLGAANRTEAVARARALGLLT